MRIEVCTKVNFHLNPPRLFQSEEFREHAPTKTCFSFTSLDYVRLDRWQSSFANRKIYNLILSSLLSAFCTKLPLDVGLTLFSVRLNSSGFATAPGSLLIIGPKELRALFSVDEKH